MSESWVSIEAREHSGQVHMIKNYEENLNLPEVLTLFRKFLNAMGFTYVESLEATTERGGKHKENSL